MANVFAKEKYLLYCEHLQLLLRLELKLKRIHRKLEFNQWQWLKPYIKFSTQKRIEAEKNEDKDGKVLCKLMNNALHGKTMESLRNTIEVRLGNNKKGYLKCTWKSCYMSHKIFGYILVVISKA